MSRLATALCLTASVCLAQSPSTDPLLAWLDRIAQQQLDDRERAIAAIRTQADADRRKAMVRAKLTELIGGLPTYSGPLNPRVTGRPSKRHAHDREGHLRKPPRLLHHRQPLQAEHARTLPCGPRAIGPHAGRQTRNADCRREPGGEGIHRARPTTRSGKASASRRICRNWAGRSREAAATSISNSARATSSSVRA